MLMVLCLAMPVLANPDPFARSVQLDPGFAYYQDRSPESIASEVKVNGYDCVRLVVARESAVNVKLVEAFREAGIAVWYTTFGNGVYGSGDLPEGAENWRMKLRDYEPDKVAAGFTYLCLKNPEYRKWKKEQIVQTLRRVPFDGFEMAEPFWPAFKGPESKMYGCLCDNCRTAFLKAHPKEKDIPEFTDKNDPNYYMTNQPLYRKWVDFRVESVVKFHEEILSSVRKECPRVKVAVWGIADDIPNPVETIREWEGIDCALIAERVKPDQFVIQTDWPDWTKPNLPPNYPLLYKPFVESVRKVSDVPIIMQADIGSWENCRRDSEWIRKCEEAARRVGMSGVTCYEFHLSKDIYEAPVRPISAKGSGQTVTITFNKRLSSDTAADPRNYTLNRVNLVGIEVDGNLVRLEVDGQPTGITVRNLTDDPTRRFWKNHPPAAMAGKESVQVDWQ